LREKLGCSAVALFAAAWIACCGGGRTPASPSDPGDPGDPLAGRPYELLVPASYAAGTPAPLIVLLHGYGASGAQQLTYFGFEQLAADRGVLVALPDGTVDRDGRRFWNATDACCDLYGSGVDDVRYLTAVLDDVQRRYTVDAARVYVVGHSNGAFMAHRMACDVADRVRGVAALAGDVWKDAARCRPAAPVAVLQIHGERDLVIPYSGGRILGGGEIPSAAESVATWAALNGCAGALSATGEQLDLVTSLPGTETRAARFDCSAGAAALWTIEDGGHIPPLAVPAWGSALFDWLEAHAGDRGN
jgi:polyhydroxybutyrate depolymerase